MSSRPKRKRTKGFKARKVKIDLGELQSIVSATSQRALTADEHKKLQVSHQLLADLILPELQDESAANVLDDEVGGDKSSDEKEKEEEKKENQEDKPKKNGHGRKRRDAFKNAKVVKISHPEIQAGQPCSCGCGKLYPLKEPARFRHFVGQAPIEVTFYEMEQFRCNSCEAIYKAPLPKNVGPDSYDATAVSSIAIHRYGVGLPFYRQAKYLTALGVPIAASTQYEVVAKALLKLQPMYDHLFHLAAQGRLVHFDDTSMKILNVVRPQGDERTGLFTTGLLSVHDEFEIAMLFTGPNHGGENRAKLLRCRDPDLPAMIQMTDALAANFVDLETDEDVIAKCLTHGRRNFVKIVDSFPIDCRRVIEAIGNIYHHDKLSKEAEHSDDERLAFHQEKSGPVMLELKEWLDRQFPEKKVEPNSRLGKAIQYLLNHWKGLTLFLRVPGVPLDNNVAERVLKTAIVHRKNSLFYKNAKGAKTGDIYMSIIQTCERNSVNPFEYITALQRHHQVVKIEPSKWLPWNYEQALAILRKVTDEPESHAEDSPNALGLHATDHDSAKVLVKIGA